MAKKSKSRVNEAGNYTKPALRRRIFQRIKLVAKGERRDNGRRVKPRCWLLHTRRLAGAIETDGTY